MFAFGGSCTATEVGQVSIIVTALLAGALLCDRHNRPWLCGLLVALTAFAADANNAEDAARFYAATFPDSKVGTVHKAPGDQRVGATSDTHRTLRARVLATQAASVMEMKPLSVDRWSARRAPSASTSIQRTSRARRATSARPTAEARRVRSCA